MAGPVGPVPPITSAVEWTDEDDMDEDFTTCLPTSARSRQPARHETQSLSWYSLIAKRRCPTLCGEFWPLLGQEGVVHLTADCPASRGGVATVQRAVDDRNR